MMSALLGAAACLAAGLTMAGELPRIDGMQLTELRLPSSVDGTEQPVVVGVPDGYEPDTPTPLLVGLHTWSYGYKQRVEPYGREAARRGWLVVLPHFRGPNTTANPAPTEAGGSLLAQHDIVDARAYMLEHYAVDPDRIYLTGASGGGHMTMLMAGKYPDLWTAAAAWVPVTDMREWWEERNSYAKHIEAVCGGAPGDSAAIDFEYLRRSPRTFITNLAHLPVLLAHGDHDPTIPVEQTRRTYERLSELPRHNATLHIFSGGHESRTAYGLDWCSEHAGARTPPTRLNLVTDESKSYYWATLHLAEASSLATADLVLGDDALSVATTNLCAVTLDLRDLPLPEDGLFVSVRSDRELRVTMRGLAEGARVVSPAESVTADTEEDGLTLTAQPAEEARSVRVEY